MLGQIKKMLGIEGVKIFAEVDEPVDLNNGNLKGKIKLITLTDSEVAWIRLRFIEKYTRGRKEGKLIDEYTIGELLLNDTFMLKKDEVIEIPFELPLKNYQSEMDKLQSRNFLASGLVRLAKRIKGVKSEYRLEAEAGVAGTKLSPMFIKEILVQS